MKTQILTALFACIAIDCAPMTDDAFGCADTPPTEGSACNLRTFPSWHNCWGDQDATPATMYHCTDAGTWTYAAVECTADPADLPCAAITPRTLSCTYGSCDQGLTVAKCDGEGNRTIMQSTCDAGAD